MNTDHPSVGRETQATAAESALDNTTSLAAAAEDATSDGAQCDQEIDEILSSAEGFESACTALLRRAINDNQRLSQSVTAVGGQQAFVRQRVDQLYDAVRQLWEAVQGHVIQTRDANQALQNDVRAELRQYQFDGPQRAIAGIFAKLFRDLIKHVDALDDLIALAADEKSPLEDAWVESLKTMRRAFETTLEDWGCANLDVTVGVEIFDPGHHEAVEALADEATGDFADGVIANVRRRGWAFQGNVLRYPQVVVA